MKCLSTRLIHELITQSLLAWHIDGIVELTGDRAIIIGPKPQVRIEPAQTGSMFRWTVTVDGRTRHAISLLAVLRQVRGALDPGYLGSGVRVGIWPVVPS